MKKKLTLVLPVFGALVLLTALLVFGQKRAQLTEEEMRLQSYTTDLSGMEIPEGVKVVSLGESTHGTAEYHTMRRDVFSQLLERYGCRTFVMEIAFGTGLQINDYILGKEGAGTAEEAVKNIELWVYQTKEFVELLQWMHDYNQKVPENEKIHFYGIDMQESDRAKEYLLKYVASVFPDKSEEYRSMLEPLKGQRDVYSDHSMPEEELKEIKLALDQISEEMVMQKEDYVAKSSLYDYGLGQECVRAILEYAISIPMFSMDIADNAEESLEFLRVRDGYMVDRVERIRELDEADMVFLTAHNVHMSRSTLVTDEAQDSKTLGEHLAERMGSEYFAIGTAFCKGLFTAVDYNYKSLGKFTVREENPFIKLFERLPGDSWYVDLGKLKEDDVLAKFLSEKHDVLDVGSMYSKELDSKENTFSMLAPRHPVIFQDSWDAMLIFKNTNATDIL